MRAIDSYVADRLTPLLFIGNDVPEEDIASFHHVRAVRIVRSTIFDADQSRTRLAQAVFLGMDNVATRSFHKHAVDVVFESATFYGWRFRIPVLAWLADFQHRHFPNGFGMKDYWKRELGFRAQVASGRLVMLSSEDARMDCERFYPSSMERTAVVRFAVSVDPTALISDPARVACAYGLPEHFFYLPNQFWKHKNHRVVIEALHALRQQGRNIVVAASGKPSDPRHPEHYDALKTLVDSLGLAYNFRFLGMVPREHVVSLMRACTALINPSLFEGWSTTVEEAKTFGVPMLLSNLRVHREQATSSAHFFDPQSFEQLAALMTAHQPLPAASRLNVEELAVKASRNRVRQFAHKFSETVERAATSFRKF